MTTGASGTGPKLDIPTAVQTHVRHDGQVDDVTQTGVGSASTDVESSQHKTHADQYSVHGVPKTEDVGTPSTGNGLKCSNTGVRLGQAPCSDRPHKGDTGLKSLEATVERLTAAYFKPGFSLILFQALRGQPTVQQRRILNKMNVKLKSELTRRHFNPHTGGIYLQSQNDITYFARMKMTDDEHAVLEAYLRNASGRLADHDRIFLAKKGMGTFEEGLLQAYSGKTAEQIATMEADYARTYGESVSQMVGKGWIKELGSVDRARWSTLRLGVDVLTPAHMAALDIHINSAAITGTRDEAVFATLVKNVGRFAEIDRAYQEIFARPIRPMLRDELDDLLTNDTHALTRLDALQRDNAEQYLALTITGDKLSAGDLANTVYGLLASGAVSPRFIESHDSGRLLRMLTGSRDPRLQGLARLIGDGDDLRTSPGACALQLRAVALEVSDPKERLAALSDVISTIATDPPTLRAQTAERFEEIFAQPFERYVRDTIRALPTTNGVNGPTPTAMDGARELTQRRVDRLMDEWTFGRSSESLMLAFGDGVALGDEFLIALRAIAPDQRANYKREFNLAHGDDAFYGLLEKLPKKLLKAAKLEMKLGEVAKGDLDKVEELVHHMIEAQRFGTEFETQLSAGLMDTLGQTGVLLDDSARQLFDQLHNLTESGTEVSREQQQALNSAFVQFTRAYTEYLGEKEDVAYTAGTVVAIGVAMAVPALAPAMFGTHGALAAGSVAAGAAKVGVKNALYGGDYDVMSWKAAGDFVKTAAIEMAAGEVAHGTLHLIGHAGKGGETVARGYLSLTLRGSERGLLRAAMELSERAVVRVGMDLTSAATINAGFGNFRSLGSSERIQAPKGTDSR